jgi:hypothetical protein
MKRIALSLVAAAALTFGFGGLFASTAEAHGPHHGHGHHGHGHHVHVYRPPVHCHPVYRPYYPSYTVGSPYVPYGVGYSAGYYPYSGITIQQPRFGLRIGF